MEIDTYLRKLEFEISIADTYNERMDKIRRYIYLVNSLLESNMFQDDEIVERLIRLCNKHLNEYTRFFFLENYDKTNLYAQPITEIEIYINIAKSKDFINTICYEVKDESGIFHRGRFKTLFEHGALLDVLYTSAVYEFYIMFDWLLIRMIESIISFRANEEIPISIFVDSELHTKTNSNDYKNDLSGVKIKLTK